MSRHRIRHVAASTPPESAAGAGWPRALRRRWWIAGAFALTLAVVAAGASFWLLRGGGGPATPRAAIIDELGMTDPNPSLIEQSRAALVKAGYTVDVFPKEQVTVDLFRSLPGRHYSIVIIRGHSSGQTSSVNSTTQQSTRAPQVSLFTSELYSTDRYVSDQRALRLDIVQIGHAYPTGEFGGGTVANPPNTSYFGITPAFMESSAQGRFRGTTVLLMGCDAINSDGMATALIKKGAGIVAGWDGPVSVGHTDEALAHVLRHLLVDHLTPVEAVAATAKDIGPDPSFGATFVSYPRS